MPITATGRQDKDMRNQKQDSGNCSRYLAALLAVGSSVAGLVSANAENSTDAMPSSTSNGTAERVALHGQATLVEQGNLAFHAPYRGPNSFDSGNIGKETLDVTAFPLGKRDALGAYAR